MASSPSSSAGSSPPDPHAWAWRRVADAIVAEPGALPEDVRRDISRGDDPPQLAPLLRKVRGEAYRIVDRDLAGLADDAALEAVLAAALGAADERLRAGLDAIG